MSCQLDVPKEHISIDIKSGMSGPILAMACDILKNLFHANMMQQIDSELKEIAQHSFPQMIEQLFAQENDTSMVQNLFQDGASTDQIMQETTMKLSIA